MTDGVMAQRNPGTEAALMTKPRLTQEPMALDKIISRVKIHTLSPQLESRGAASSRISFRLDRDQAGSSKGRGLCPQMVEMGT